MDANHLEIVIAGSTSPKSIQTKDAATGKEYWAAGDSPASSGGPRVEMLAGVPQVLADHNLSQSSLGLTTGPQLRNINQETCRKG